jgi:beta-carotene hydroxylase
MKLPRLRHAEDLRSLGFLTVTLPLLTAAWSGCFRSLWMIVPLALCCFICCIIAHNHMHHPTFRGRLWNSLFQLILMFGIGQPPTGIITAHNERHHGHPDGEEDFVRTNLVGFRWNAVNLIAFPFVSIATMFREKPGDLRRWRKSRPRLFRQALLERTVFWIVVSSALIADWRSTLLYLGVPWISAQLLLIGVNLLQHQDCDMESEYDHSRNVTGRIANWFLLNNGYHTAHHLRPSMHWSLLPAFHRSRVLPNIHPSLDHKTFTGLLIERLRRPSIRHAR